MKKETFDKFCYDCHQIKSLQDFHRDKKKKDGRNIYCKDCCKIRSKRYNKPKLIPDYKKCNKCKKVKSNDFFHKKINTKDGLCNKCKECRKPLCKKYVENNKEKIKETQRLYYLKNRETLNKKRREWYRKKSKDSLYRIKHNIKSLILINFKSYIKDFKGKSLKTEEILGCTFLEFKEHIETQFLNWMTWENHGGYDGFRNESWDLDHIIPVSIALTEKEIIELSHYSNFQPLCSYINRNIKKDKVFPLCNVITKKTYY